MKEMRRRRFVEAVNGILRELDFEELDRSCNGRDPSYAQEILQKMHQAFLDIYGTDCLTDPAATVVELPAVFRGRRTGEVAVGVVAIDLTAKGCIRNAVLLTPVGVLNQSKEKLSRIQKTYLINQFKESGNGVLFASGSMWEGIDCAGDILSWSAEASSGRICLDQSYPG